MNILRIFLCFSIFLVAGAPAAHAKDLILTLNYTLALYKSGHVTPIEKQDRVFIRSRISKLLKTATADTSELWYKYEREKHNRSLEDQWNDIKSGSHFSLEYDVEKRGEVPTSDKFIPEEIIVGIHDKPEDGFFGDVMAYNSKTGEIKGYQIDQKYLVSLYCYEKTTPYLPDHYKDLFEKYNTSEYLNSGISCNSYTDAYLKNIEKEKAAKKEKWRKIMQKKHGLKPLPKDDEDEDEE